MRLLEWLRNEPGSPRRLTLEDQVATILDAEERTLHRLGIPVPPLREGVRTAATGLLLPIFDLSQYLFLPVLPHIRISSIRFTSAGSGMRERRSGLGPRTRGSDAGI